MARLDGSMIGSVVVRNRCAVNRYGVDSSYSLSFYYNYGIEVVNVTETHLYYKHTSPSFSSLGVQVVALSDGLGDDAWVVTSKNEDNSVAYGVADSPSISSLKDCVGKVVLRTKPCGSDWSYTNYPQFIVGYDNRNIIHKDVNKPHNKWNSSFLTSVWDDGNWTEYNPNPVVLFKDRAKIVSDSIDKINAFHKDLFVTESKARFLRASIEVESKKLENNLFEFITKGSH